MLLQAHAVLAALTDVRAVRKSRGRHAHSLRVLAVAFSLGFALRARAAAELSQVRCRHACACMLHSIWHTLMSLTRETAATEVLLDRKYPTRFGEFLPPTTIAAANIGPGPTTPTNNPS